MTGSAGRTRILVVSSSLSEGGAERFASTLLVHLDRLVFEPHLCLFRDPVTYPLPEDVPVRVLHKQKPWHWLRTARRLARAVEEIRPQVILSNMAATGRITGMALGRCRTPPAWIARVAADPAPDDGRLVRWLTRRTLGGANVFVANSHGLKAGFSKWYPFVRGRIRQIYNPVDFKAVDALAAEKPAIEADSQKPLLVSVGRLNRQKRPDIMLQAFAQLRAQTDAELWMVGDGPLRARTEAQVKQLGLQSSVRLPGFCANPYALMRQAAVYVLSSDYEGLPNALIEAQGMGLPAVSTSCPYGPEEIIRTGQTGILTPVGDAAALAAGIAGLLSEPKHSREMGQAAREDIRNRFDSQIVVRQWEELILSVCE